MSGSQYAPRRDYILHDAMRITNVSGLKDYSSDQDVLRTVYIVLTSASGISTTIFGGTFNPKLDSPTGIDVPMQDYGVLIPSNAEKSYTQVQTTVVNVSFFPVKVLMYDLVHDT